MNERIIVIRPGAIGDALLTFPILHVLKEQRQASISFVSNSAVIPLALEFKLADEVFDYNAPIWSELFSASGIRSSLLLAILRHTSTAICWLRDPDGVVEHNLQNAGVTHVVSAPGRPDETSNVHIVTYLAGTVGIESMDRLSPFKGSERMLNGGLYPTAKPLGREQSAPTISPQSQTTRSVAIHPGSGGSAKCWPIAYFARVITALWRQHIPVLLLAGPADTERLTELLQQIDAPPAPSLLEQMINAPLLEVATRLRSCAVYLGNDSGITHLAAQLGVPTIALFGPSNPDMWKPVGPDVQVLYDPLLERIQVEKVLATLWRFLNRELMYKL